MRAMSMLLKMGSDIVKKIDNRQGMKRKTKLQQSDIFCAIFDAVCAVSLISENS